MAFDKEAYRARRNAEKLRIASGAPKSKEKGRYYTPYEIQAMQYHKRIMDAVDAGDITKEQGEAELLSASKDAADNLEKSGAPEILVAVVEKLIIHGSYEGLRKAAIAQEEARNVENTDKVS